MEQGAWGAGGGGGSESARSQSSTQKYAEFRGAHPNRPFFAALRVPKPLPVKPVKHDVPSIVIPNKYEMRMLTSRTPRKELLTLPPVHPGGMQPHAPTHGGGAKTARPFLGSVTPRRGVLESTSCGDVAHPLPHPPPLSNGSAVPKLPQLTFNPAAADLELGLGPARSKVDIAERFRSRLTEYDDTGDNDEAHNRNEITKFETKHRVGDEKFMSIGGSSAIPDHHTVTTIDEEASTRVLKVMFQLNLTRNSNIISRLKELEPAYLHRKIIQELGYKKQMSRDEFFVLLCKVTKDDYINKRDCMTLFSVFDDDKSGLVDAVEFVSGFMTLIAAGEHDIAFKFIHTVLDSRGEKTIVNAFISRFELQLLVAAAQHHFADDKEVVALLDTVPSAFNFSHHLGRIPIVQFRDAITSDPDLLAIFSALPNPSRPAKEAAANAAAFAAVGRKAAAGDKSVTLQVPGGASGTGGDTMAGASSTDAHREQSDVLAHVHILADQYMSQNHDLQQRAEEHDSPRWWVSGGIVYRASEGSPYPQPVFHKETEKRR